MATPFQPDSSVALAPVPHAQDVASVLRFIDELVGDDLHAKRVLSLANGVLGVLHGASLAIHAIGEALAAHRDLVPKRAIKQVDRFLSNRGIDPELLGPAWVSFVRGARMEAPSKNGASASGIVRRLRAGGRVHSGRVVSIARSGVVLGRA